MELEQVTYAMAATPSNQRSKVEKLLCFNSPCLPPSQQRTPPVSPTYASLETPTPRASPALSAPPTPRATAYPPPLLVYRHKMPAMDDSLLAPGPERSHGYPMRGPPVMLAPRYLPYRGNCAPADDYHPRYRKPYHMALYPPPHHIPHHPPHHHPHPRSPSHGPSRKFKTMNYPHHHPDFFPEHSYYAQGYPEHYLIAEPECQLMMNASGERERSPSPLASGGSSSSSASSLSDRSNLDTPCDSEIEDEDETLLDMQTVEALSRGIDGLSLSPEPLTYEDRLRVEIGRCMSDLLLHLPC